MLIVFAHNNICFPFLLDAANLVYFTLMRFSNSSLLFTDMFQAWKTSGIVKKCSEF